MKKIIFLFIISIIFTACGSQNDKTTSQENTDTIETIDPANLETIEISVVGMTCGGCERTVQTAIGNLPGVQEVKASFQDSTAIVTFDKTKASFEEMKTTVEGKGYEVKDFKVVE